MTDATLLTDAKFVTNAKLLTDAKLLGDVYCRTHGETVDDRSLASVSCCVVNVK